MRRDAATSTEPWGFTGHAEDSNGLVWGRARYYEPEVGQWLREDFVWTTPRFNYADGAPCSKVDPTGLMTYGEWADLVERSCRNGNALGKWHGAKFAQHGSITRDAVRAAETTLKKLKNKWDGYRDVKGMRGHHIIPKAEAGFESFRTALQLAFGMADAEFSEANLVDLDDKCHEALHAEKSQHYLAFLTKAMKDKQYTGETLYDIAQLLLKGAVR